MIASHLLRVIAPMKTITGILFTFLLLFLGLGTALGQNVKVPSDFIGIWQGLSASKDKTTWNVTLAMLEGSGKDAIGLMEWRKDGSSCTYTLVLDSAQKKDKGNAQEKNFQAKTQPIDDDCLPGELEFDLTIPNRMIVDARFGRATEITSFIMEQLDDGSLGKALGKC